MKTFVKGSCPGLIRGLGRVRKITAIKLALSWWAICVVSPAFGADNKSVSLNDLNLSWIRSAIWIEERTMVVLTDSIGKQVVEIAFSEDGDPTTRLSTTTLQATYVAESSTGFLQIVNELGTPREIHWFSPTLAEKGTTLLPKPKRDERLSPRGPSENAVLALYSWIVAGDRIFAYGALDDGPSSERPYKYGFFTYKLKTPGSQAEFPQADLVETFQEVEYYTLGVPYLVALGSEVYYLEMGSVPALKFYDVENGGLSVDLSRLSDIRGFREPLPRLNADRPVAEVYAEIESLAMPAGLYADPEENFLYLLYREPDNSLTQKNKATCWTMIKLQPKEPKFVKKVGIVRLPTTAPHLTVLFTPKSVLLFEKSSVHTGTRKQDVEAMRILPKSWVTNLENSPIRAK